MAPPTRPIADRFAAKVAQAGPDECWEWTGGRNTNGYGVIASGGRRGVNINAHRVAYELAHGPIPDGLVIDHLCENRGCVNPRHLEAVQHDVNIVRATGKRTTCKRGHPLVLRRFQLHGEFRQQRHCPICAADRRRERNQRAVA